MNEQLTMNQCWRAAWEYAEKLPAGYNVSVLRTDNGYVVYATKDPHTVKQSFFMGEREIRQ